MPRMMTPMIELVKLGKRPVSHGTFTAFRFREVGGDVLLTNPFGDWIFVKKDELYAMAKGEVGEGSALYDRLAARNFVRARVDVDAQAARMARKKRFLDHGPNLHAMVVTLRCNESCVYCHASRADMDRVDTDMSKETAEKAVELALQTTSPGVTIEFQGGEPLVNFDVMKHIVQTALAKNRAYGKALEFTMVSNLSLMDDEKLRFLIDNKVQVCTSIDGPEALHNKQRILAGGNAWRESVKWIKRINDEYARMGLDPVLYHVEALLTTTRALLPYPKELVDTYVDLGCRAIFIRPVDPFGWASRTAKTVEYPRADYLTFYKAATDYILELNKQGVQALERFAAIFLTKILGDEEPNFLDVRSPGGAGIGQLAYSYDGKIFTSDEGRMVAQMGDPFFEIGHVDTSSYRDLMTHPTVRALSLASNLETQPDCTACTYNPYCGIVPEHSYRTQGSIFGRMRESVLCAVHKGIQDYLFDLLRQDDPQTMEILRRWTTVRERTHFLQASAASLARRRAQHARLGDAREDGTTVPWRRDVGRAPASAQSPYLGEPGRSRCSPRCSPRPAARAASPPTSRQSCSPPRTRSPRASRLPPRRRRRATRSSRARTSRGPRTGTTRSERGRAEAACAARCASRGRSHRRATARGKHARTTRSPTGRTRTSWA